MAYDEELRRRVRDELGGGTAGIEEKPVVGGIGFMWRGHLLCGVMGDALLVSTARDDYEALLGEPGARPMVMGGRTSRRWLLVDGATVAGAPALRTWIDRARAYVGSLPPK
ncbi:MAG TPA: TfoX/Sxy family protein [Candidatus Dormibacteraeota bacterium]|nr:TfoX/Sxy family protein [Candidatus Dormibacteraeota bacterium]